MTTIQTILITALLFAWLCISISFLVTSIQSFVYDRKREKRELAPVSYTHLTLPTILLPPYRGM